VSIGLLVARQCDRYVNSIINSYPKNKLAQTIEKSMCCKARLLHYYAKNDDHESQSSVPDDSSSNQELEFSSWCGWHNDHGSLTGLTSAMFLDKDGKQVPNPDPMAGLYIRTRKSELKKINIPADHLGFQIGETAQIHSGGILQATPHAVRGSSLAGISRESYAVFMEPNWFESMSFPEVSDTLTLSLSQCI
jgi:isopenicillin N synthase-like dioxygenase